MDLIKPVKEMPKLVQHKIGKIRVMCPYCPVGFATVSFKTASDGNSRDMRILNFKDPVKCTSPLCNRWFVLKHKTEIVGVRMEDIKDGRKEVARSFGRRT